MSAEAAADRLRRHMTYRTLQDGRAIAATTVDYDWWVLDEDRLRAECAANGLSVRTAGDRGTAGDPVGDLYVLTPIGGAGPASGGT